jgi:hypothetical protein
MTRSRAGPSCSPGVPRRDRQRSGGIAARRHVGRRLSGAAVSAEPAPMRRVSQGPKPRGRLRRSTQLASALLNRLTSAELAWHGPDRRRLREHEEHKVPFGSLCCRPGIERCVMRCIKQRLCRLLAHFDLPHARTFRKFEKVALPADHLGHADLCGSGHPPSTSTEH